MCCRSVQGNRGNYWKDDREIFWEQEWDHNKWRLLCKGSKKGKVRNAFVECIRVGHNRSANAYSKTMRGARSSSVCKDLQVYQWDDYDEYIQGRGKLGWSSPCACCTMGEASNEHYDIFVHCEDYAPTHLIWTHLVMRTTGRAERREEE